MQAVRFDVRACIALFRLKSVRTTAVLCRTSSYVSWCTTKCDLIKHVCYSSICLLQIQAALMSNCLNKPYLHVPWS